MPILRHFTLPNPQYCAVCAEGYFGGGAGKLCEECGGSSFLTFLPVVVVACLLLGFLVLMLVRCCRGNAPMRALELEAAAAVAKEGGDLVSASGKGARAKMARSKPRNGRCARLFARLSRKASDMGVKVKIIISLFQLLNGIGVVFSIPYAYPLTHARTLAPVPAYPRPHTLARTRVRTRTHTLARSHTISPPPPPRTRAQVPAGL